MTPAIRDFVAVFCLLQGTVRIVDGRLFQVFPTLIMDDLVYGVMQVMVAAWLLLTRALRDCGAGQFGAALTAGIFVMLAADLLPRNATSGIPALLIAWVMAVESRYVAVG